MVWEDYAYTQYISLHIHRLNTSHSQYSVCPWQLESSRLSVRNTRMHPQQTHIDTVHVKTAALTIQSRALQCPSLKSVTQQERIHRKVLRNYRQRNSLHSCPPLSSCSGLAPQTHWRVIIDAQMEMMPPAAPAGWNNPPVTSVKDSCITRLNRNITSYIYHQ